MKNKNEVSDMIHRAMTMLYVDSITEVCHISPREERDEHGNVVAPFQPYYERRDYSSPFSSRKPVYVRIYEPDVTRTEWWCISCLMCGLKEAVDFAVMPPEPEDSNPNGSPDVARATSPSMVNDADDSDTNDTGNIMPEYNPDDSDDSDGCEHRGTLTPFTNGMELHERCTSCGASAFAGCL